MNWFEQLTGFAEKSPEQVRAQLELSDGWLTSKVNGGSWFCGSFSAPSLDELRRLNEAALLSQGAGRLQLDEAVADVQELHADPANAGALFQVASQFNLLEMISPAVTPERGVGVYGHDRTQGPACAIACGAGTIWRNYFMPLPGQTGQSSQLQFDGLAGLGRELGNKQEQLWQMRNGYALASREGLEYISQRLQTVSAAEREKLMGLLRIGIQADAQVTLPGCSHRVTQLYCSALPVAYSQLPVRLWQDFARLVLDAAYEASFHAATLHYQKYGQARLYLTLLGGGAFGNEDEWILSAIARALRLFATVPLEVVIVSYRCGNPAVQALVEQWSS